MISVLVFTGKLVSKIAQESEYPKAVFQTTETINDRINHGNQTVTFPKGFWKDTLERFVIGQSYDLVCRMRPSSFRNRKGEDVHVNNAFVLAYDVRHDIDDQNDGEYRPPPDVGTGNGADPNSPF